MINDANDTARLLSEAMRRAALSNLELQHRFTRNVDRYLEPTPDTYMRLVVEEVYELGVDITEIYQDETNNVEPAMQEFTDVLVTLAGLYDTLAKMYGSERCSAALSKAVNQVVAKNAAKTTETHTYNGKKIVRKD